MISQVGKGVINLSLSFQQNFSHWGNGIRDQLLHSTQQYFSHVEMLPITLLTLKEVLVVVLELTIISCSLSDIKSWNSNRLTIYEILSS